MLTTIEEAEASQKVRKTYRLLTHPQVNTIISRTEPTYEAAYARLSKSEVLEEHAVGHAGRPSQELRDHSLQPRLLLVGGGQRGVLH